MKIVQTLWTGNHKSLSPLTLQSGWLYPEYHWMSWALSSLLLRKYSDQLELYTDALGRHILIDLLKLPYTKVHIAFDHTFKIPPGLFALSKIKTYSLQNSPFAHVDGDLYLWNALPDALKKAEVISSNLEVNLFFNKEILGEMEAHFEVIPEHLRDVFHRRTIYSSNAGIFGGTNLEFIKKYCTEAFQIIKLNSSRLDRVNTGNLNCLIEQVSLYYLAEQEGVPISYYVKKPVDHPLYQEHWRFSDIPNVAMIHPVGGCKRERYVLDHLAGRLRLEFPEYYYRIIQLFRRSEIPLRSKFYHYIDPSGLVGSEADDKTAETSTGKENVGGLPAPVFANSFRRSLACIREFEEIEISDFKELSDFVSQPGTSDRLKEIFKLESKVKEAYEAMLKSLRKEAYLDEVKKYRSAACFFLQPGWSHKSVYFSNATSITETRRDWRVDQDSETIRSLKKIYDSKEKKITVTISQKLTNLEIYETYHNGIDAAILNLLKDPMQITDILRELLIYFEDVEDSDNPNYQNLVFDTIKRLAFENIISVGEL